MNISLLSHFSKVSKTTKSNSYNCLCPAHEDRLASLSIKFADDGRILMHCFAGCDITSILGAVGLDLDDIVPERKDLLKPLGKIYNPFAVLKSLQDEVLLVAVVAAELAQGKPLEEGDRKRLLESVRLIREGYEYAKR
ncbi:DNA primase [Methylophilaceae bacterium]|nr:DNA primase [Methylophilaceae bacterium]